MSIKLLIHINPEQPPAPQPPKKPPLLALKDKVEYAIDCIRLEHDNWQEAVQFLRDVYNKLQKTHGFKDDHKVITDMITPLLNIYGNLPASADDEGSKNG